MNTRNWLLASAILVTWQPLTAAQGTFINLDFESANLTVVPAGSLGGAVRPEEAIPGWTPYGAGVFHNDVSLGGPAIIVYGPQWDTSQILDGKYSLELNNDFNGHGVAAIGQTGQVPTGVKSLVFYAPYASLKISFAGQDLTFFRLSSGPKYSIFGADISHLAGQTGELRFSAGPDFLGAGIIDDIHFSTQSVPEPSLFDLAAFGGLLLLLSSKQARWRERRFHSTVSSR